jgi:integrase
MSLEQLKKLVRDIDYLTNAYVESHSSNRNIVSINVLSLKTAMLLLITSGTRNSVQLSSIARKDISKELCMIHIFDKSTPENCNGRFVFIPHIVMRLIEELTQRVEKVTGITSHINHSAFVWCCNNNFKSRLEVMPLTMSRLKEAFGKKLGCLRASFANVMKQKCIEQTMLSIQLGHTTGEGNSFGAGSTRSLYEFYQAIVPCLNDFAQSLDVKHRKNRTLDQWYGKTARHFVKPVVRFSGRKRKEQVRKMLDELFEQKKLVVNDLVTKPEVESLLQRLKLHDDFLLSDVKYVKNWICYRGELTEKAKNAFKRYALKTDPLPYKQGFPFKVDNAIMAQRLAMKELPPEQIKYLFHYSNAPSFKQKDICALLKWLSRMRHFEVFSSYGELFETIKLIYTPYSLVILPEKHLELRSVRFNKNTEGGRRQGVKENEIKHVHFKAKSSIDVKNELLEIFARKGPVNKLLSDASRYLKALVDLNLVSRVVRAMIQTILELVDETSENYRRLKLSSIKSYTNIFNYEQELLQVINGCTDTKRGFIALNSQVTEKSVNLDYQFERFLHYYSRSIYKFNRKIESGLNVNILTRVEYQKLREYFSKNIKKDARLLYLAFSLILGFKVGLRRKEVKKLDLRLIEISGGKIVVNIIRGSKSEAGNRRVHAQLDSSELNIVEELLKLAQNQGRFKIGELMSSKFEENMELLTAHLQKLTLDSHFRFHHLRRSFVNTMLHHLYGRKLDTFASGHKSLQTALVNYSVNASELTKYYNYTFVDGWETSSVAKILNISESTARKRMSRRGLRSGCVSIGAFFEQPVNPVTKKLKVGDLYYTFDCNVIENIYESLRLTFSLNNSGMEAKTKFKKFVASNRQRRCLFERVSVSQVVRSLDAIKENVLPAFNVLLHDTEKLLLIKFLFESVEREFLETNRVKIEGKLKLSRYIVDIFTRLHLFEVTYVNNERCLVIPRKVFKTFAKSKRGFVLLSYIIEECLEVMNENHSKV